MQDSDGRTRPIRRISSVIDCDGRGIASLHEFQSGTCSQRILDSELGQSGMLHKHANEWIGLREEKGVYVFRRLDFSGNDSWEKEVEGPQFDAV